MCWWLYYYISCDQSQNKWSRVADLCRVIPAPTHQTQDINPSISEKLNQQIYNTLQATASPLDIDCLQRHRKHVQVSSRNCFYWRIQVYVLLFMIKNPCCQGRCLCSAKYLSSINTGSFVFNNFAFDHYYYELQWESEALIISISYYCHHSIGIRAHYSTDWKL